MGAAGTGVKLCGMCAGGRTGGLAWRGSGAANIRLALSGSSQATRLRWPVLRRCAMRSLTRCRAAACPQVGVHTATSRGGSVVYMLGLRRTKSVCRGGVRLALTSSCSSPQLGCVRESLLLFLTQPPSAITKVMQRYAAQAILEHTEILPLPPECLKACVTMLSAWPPFFLPPPQPFPPARLF